MSKINQKKPFIVPDGYFDRFEEKINRRIRNKNAVGGFITPVSYFEKVENEILKKVNYPEAKLPVAKPYWWKAVAVAAIFALFFFNQNTPNDSTEFAAFFIEDYLTFNTTYEIAELSDYALETEMFGDMYESIAIEDMIELNLYGESPTNLNLFEDE